MFSYNLVDEPWIPCVFVDGQPGTVSLGEVLIRAHEIREIVADTPLATMALHRLLLAILHRIFGPRDARAWHALYGAAAFDAEVISTYLYQWRHRFDLFDPDRPFFQVAGMDPNGRGSVAKLFHEHNLGKVLFDHSWDEKPFPISPAQAVRQILVHQALAFGGMVSLPKGSDPKVHKFAKAGLLVKCAVFFIQGRCLRETLVLNLHRYAPEAGEPFAGVGTDMPCWERSEPAQVQTRELSGYLDLLTWQSRRIWLQPEADAHGGTVVHWALIFKGESLPEGLDLKGREPMVAFKANPNPKEGSGWIPLGFREGRALWRDSIALMELSSSRTRPRILSWLADVNADLAALDIQAFGLASDQAKAEFWRYERFQLPRPYLEDDGLLLESIQTALHLAEEIGRIFAGGFVELPGQKKDEPGALRVLVQELLGEARNLPDRVKALGCEAFYWAALEVPFRALLSALPERTAGEDAEDAADRALEEWAMKLRSVATEAFELATAGLQGTGSGLRAVAIAEGILRRQIHALTSPHLPKEQEILV